MRLTLKLSAALMALFAIAFASALPLRADEPAEAAGPESVEMFQAMADGDIDVRIVVPDAEHANVMIENLTDRPLHVEMPAAFAGVPALAQFGGFGGGQAGGAGIGGGGFGGGQGVGGGLGGGGLGGGGFGGGAAFDVAPDAVRKIETAVVCLEHGRPDPTARMEYKIVPIEEFTADTSVQQLCAMLGNGEIDQVSAQAAAWHLTDDKTWQELAAMEKVHLRNGYVEYYFDNVILQRAQVIVVEADSRAAEMEPATTSPGELEVAKEAAE